MYDSKQRVMKKSKEYSTYKSLVFTEWCLIYCVFPVSYNLHLKMHLTHLKVNSVICAIDLKLNYQIVTASLQKMCDEHINDTYLSVCVHVDMCVSFLFLCIRTQMHTHDPSPRTWQVSGTCSSCLSRTLA